MYKKILLISFSFIFLGISGNNVNAFGPSCKNQHIIEDNTDFYEKGNPTSKNTLWQTSDKDAPCFYKCNKEWSGVKCDEKVPGYCGEKPNIPNGNAIFEDKNPYFTNTDRQQITFEETGSEENKIGSCFYKCTDGYSGPNCDKLTEEEACFKLLKAAAPKVKFPNSPLDQNGSGGHFTDVYGNIINLEKIIYNTQTGDEVDASTYELFSGMHFVETGGVDSDGYPNGFMKKTNDGIDLYNNRLNGTKGVTSLYPNGVNPNKEDRSTGKSGNYNDDGSNNNDFYRIFKGHKIFKAKKNIVGVLSFSGNVVLSEYASLGYNTRFVFPVPSENDNYVNGDPYPDMKSMGIFALHSINGEFLSCGMFQYQPRLNNGDGNPDYSTVNTDYYGTDVMDNSGFEFFGEGLDIPNESINYNLKSINGTNNSYINQNFTSYTIQGKEFSIGKVSLGADHLEGTPLFDSKMLTINYNNKSKFFNEFLTFPLQVKAMTNPDTASSLHDVVVDFRNSAKDNTCLYVTRPEGSELPAGCNGEAKSSYVAFIIDNGKKFFSNLVFHLFGVESANARIGSFTDEDKKMMDNQIIKAGGIQVFDGLPIEIYNKIMEIDDLNLRNSLIYSVSVGIDSRIKYKVDNNKGLSNLETVFKGCNISYTDRISILKSFINNIKDPKKIDLNNLNYTDPRFGDCIIPFPDKRHIGKVIEGSFFTNQILAKNLQNIKSNDIIIDNKLELDSLLKEKIKIELEFNKNAEKYQKILDEGKFVKGLGVEIAKYQKDYEDKTKIIDEKIDNYNKITSKLTSDIIDNNKDINELSKKSFSPGFAYILISLFIILGLIFIFAGLNKRK